MIEAQGSRYFASSRNVKIDGTGRSTRRSLEVISLRSRPGIAGKPDVGQSDPRPPCNLLLSMPGISLSSLQIHCQTFLT